MWLSIHVNVGPLATPAVEGVGGARGVDAVEEGCPDEAGNEANDGGEEGNGTVNEVLGSDLVD
jgi:hypothetical protein